MITEYASIVLKSLTSTPINTANKVNDFWELATPRVLNNSRIIGTENFLMAKNALLAFLTKEDKASLVNEIFNNSIAELEEHKLIRKIPANIRKTFKVV